MRGTTCPRQPPCVRRNPLDLLLFCSLCGALFVAPSIASLSSTSSEVLEGAQEPHQILQGKRIQSHSSFQEHKGDRLCYQKAASNQGKEVLGGCSRTQTCNSLSTLPRQRATPKVI